LNLYGCFIYTFSHPFLSYTRLELIRINFFTNTYEKRVDPRGKVYYWLAGELITDSDEVGTDIAAVRKNNKISITPISYDMTKYDMIDNLSEIVCKDGNCNWY
jgi:5'-nucleotidase